MKFSQFKFQMKDWSFGRFTVNWLHKVKVKHLKKCLKENHLLLNTIRSIQYHQWTVSYSGSQKQFTIRQPQDLDFCLKVQEKRLFMSIFCMQAKWLNTDNNSQSTGERIILILLSCQDLDLNLVSMVIQKQPVWQLHIRLSGTCWEQQLGWCQSQWRKKTRKFMKAGIMTRWQKNCSKLLKDPQACLLEYRLWDCHSRMKKFLVWWKPYKRR